MRSVKVKLQINALIIELNALRANFLKSLCSLRVIPACPESCQEKDSGQAGMTEANEYRALFMQLSYSIYRKHSPKY
jgi:hypothetical protein